MKHVLFFHQQLLVLDVAHVYVSFRWAFPKNGVILACHFGIDQISEVVLILANELVILS